MDGDKRGFRCHSHVLWMALEAGDHLLNWLALKANLINGSEEGKPLTREREGD